MFFKTQEFKNLEEEVFFLGKFNFFVSIIFVLLFIFPINIENKIIVSTLLFFFLFFLANSYLTFCFNLKIKEKVKNKIEIEDKLSSLMSLENKLEQLLKKDSSNKLEISNSLTFKIFILNICTTYPKYTILNDWEVIIDYRETIVEKIQELEKSIEELENLNLPYFYKIQKKIFKKLKIIAWKLIPDKKRPKK